MVEENKVSFESLPANSEPLSQNESRELKEQRREEVEEEEDFGDFTSVQPSDKNQLEEENIKCSAPSLLPPLAASENVDEKIMDFHQLILDELKDSSKILKEGKIWMMRLGGFPKKMMRKEVNLVFIMIKVSPRLIFYLYF